MEFYPFPRTPHLSSNSHVIDQDKIMSINQADRLCRSCKVVLQEKVDGTNVSVFFDTDRNPVCQKRAGIIGKKEKLQYNMFRGWVYKNYQNLWDCLGTQRVLFGEWLWRKHAILYDSLPDYFLSFDLYDIKHRMFTTKKEMLNVLNQRFHSVPVIWQGKVTSGNDLLGVIRKHLEESAYGSEKPEGVYIRFERNEQLVARAKFRRKCFTPGFKNGVKQNKIVIR